MLICILLLFLCCNTATTQPSLNGGWQLTGMAAQKEMPDLSGELKLFIYPQKQAVLQSGKAGSYRLLPAQWNITEKHKPHLHIQTKDGSMNSISNLNTSINRWELTADKNGIQVHPYHKTSMEESQLLNLHFLNKNTIVLSDKMMSIIFQKKD